MITQMASNLYYDGKVIADKKATGRMVPIHQLFPPSLFLDVEPLPREASDHPLSSQAQARVVLALLHTIELQEGGLSPETVIVITPYKAQYVISICSLHIVDLYSAELDC